MARHKYRLLYGRVELDHPEDLDKPPHQRRLAMFGHGAIITSDLDLLRFNGAAGDARKFERILPEDGRADPGPRTFDPSKETIDQFAARMRALDAPPPTFAATEEPAAETEELVGSTDDSE